MTRTPGSGKDSSWSWTTYSRHAPCPGRRRFPRDMRCAASVARTGRSQWPGPWRRTAEPISTIRALSSDSPRPGAGAKCALRTGHRGVVRRVRGRGAHRRPGHRPVRDDGALPERRHRRRAPAARAGLPPTWRCRSVERRAWLRPMGHRHRGHQPGWTRLPQPWVPARHRQRIGLPQAATLTHPSQHASHTLRQ